MNCIVCGASPTIRSHLIPRVMAVEVQVGSAHAVLSPSSQRFRETQSGFVDLNILCARCDASIGRFEGSTAKALQSLRSAGRGVLDGAVVSAAQMPEVTLRFYAALLWKYAVARPNLGRIDLGPFTSELQDFAFGASPLPGFFDAALMRLRLNTDDVGVFAYRAPRMDRKHGLNIYRIMVGGVLAFVKVDQRPWRNTPFRQFALASAASTRALVLRAQEFEEFKIPQRFVHNDSRLSAFLDKQEFRAAR